MPSSFKVASSAISVGLFAVLSANVACANDTVSAEALFRAGKALADQHRYAEACPKLQASLELDPALGTLLNLADCHEHVGAVATAWGEWTLGASRARRKGDAARAELSQRRADGLESRLPKLRIVARGKADGLAILRDDAPVPAGMMGEELPVDPGRHTVVVQRGDVVLHRVEVALQERGRETVSVDLDALAKASPPPAPPVAGAARTASAGPPPTVAMRVRSGFQSATIAIGSVGILAAVGLEATALALKLSENGSDCASLDKVTYCNDKGLKNIGVARTLATAGQWVGIGGIAVLGVGVALTLTAPPSAPPAQPDKDASSARLRSVWASPWASANGARGVTVGGAF
jgi:hypothetical protein